MSVSPWTAELGGISFGSLDGSGNLYTLEELEGWDSPTSTGAVESRTGARGGWSTRAYLAPRVMTLKGAVVCPQEGMLDRALDAVLSAIPFDDYGPITVTRDSTRVAYVRQDGEPSITVLSPTTATYDVPLIAADPLRYGAFEKTSSVRLPIVTGGLTIPTTVPFAVDATTVSGVVRLFNEGNFPAPLRVLIYGPVSSPSLVNSSTGERFTFQGDVQAGDYLDVNLDRRTVHLNGVASRRGFVSGEFFALRPGANDVAFTAPTYDSEAYALFAWRDSWK